MPQVDLSQHELKTLDRLITRRIEDIRGHICIFGRSTDTYIQGQTSIQNLQSLLEKLREAQ